MHTQHKTSYITGHIFGKHNYKLVVFVFFFFKFTPWHCAELLTIERNSVEPRELVLFMRSKEINRPSPASFPLSSQKKKTTPKTKRHITLRVDWLIYIHSGDARLVATNTAKSQVECYEWRCHSSHRWMFSFFRFYSSRLIELTLKIHLGKSKILLIKFSRLKCFIYFWRNFLND